VDAHCAAEAQAGTLLAAAGLRSTAFGARVRHAGGKSTVLDGPFAEIKELIAGYWLIRADSLEEAIAWAKRNCYPSGPQVEVEVRALQAPAPAFTPELRAAEQRMREHQLESALHAELAGR
ncbi:MAG: YciI family protein, partial [Gammaproteobacteria bacterium]